MVRSRLTVLFLAALFALAACDSAPVDPLDPRVNLATLLLGDGAVAARNTQLSMPGLLHAAIHKVYVEQGADAARALVADLRRLHEQAQRAVSNGDREASDARLQAVRAEEIRVVLRVFGDGLAERVVDAVRDDAAQLGATLREQEAQGMGLTRPRELLAHIDALLAQSDEALQRGHPGAALDAAARAAAATDAIRHLLVDAARAPTIDELFQSALAQLRTTNGDVLSRATARYDALQRSADAAVRSGDRNGAHDALKAARAEQIRIVLAILGDAAVDRLLDGLRERGDEARRGMERANAAGRDVYRLERMLETVRDLQTRATRARTAGDAATALDLGSHAATLVNAIHIALTSD